MGGNAIPVRSVIPASPDRKQRRDTTGASFCNSETA
jgi:hypothetical protein